MFFLCDLPNYDNNLSIFKEAKGEPGVKVP